MESAKATYGHFDFTNPASKTRAIARLAESTKLSIYRYGATPEKAPTVTISVDGQLVAESDGTPSTLDPGSLTILEGKAFDLHTSFAGHPPPGEALNCGQYKNVPFDASESFAPAWSLTKKGGTLATEHVATLCRFKHPATVRVSFASSVLAGGGQTNDIFCRLYVDGALLTAPGGGSLLFPALNMYGSTGNSIDVTGAWISVGFHENMKKDIEGSMSGTFRFGKAGLADNPLLESDFLTPEQIAAGVFE